MVSMVPGVNAISEPYSFVYLHGLYMRKHITMEYYRQLLRTLVRIQFKREEKVRLAERETLQEPAHQGITQVLFLTCFTRLES